ncbi:hypothetical protein KIPB_000125 [Kipferlia bialata]|uniref:Uncharacterized protein n=1 Tax=Kipferlia bialata TaxID=797122 RepID=A0A9K3CNQ5_9EUKA|nr:hypothetical protein KIPB_000125 [Kipferlia bialata]|eukprot:g125.t1
MCIHSQYLPLSLFMSKTVKKGKTAGERQAQAMATQQKLKTQRANTPSRERSTPVVSDRRAARSTNNTGIKRSRSTARQSGSRAASPMSAVRPVSPSARVAMSYRNPVEAAKALQGPAVASLKGNPIYKVWRETNKISLGDDFKLEPAVQSLLFTLNVHFMSIEISDDGNKKNLISGEFHDEASHAQTCVYALLGELRRMREQTARDFDAFVMRMDTKVLKQKMEETEQTLAKEEAEEAKKKAEADSSEEEAEHVPKSETEKKDVATPSPSPSPSPRKIAAQVTATVSRPKRYASY